ncbi:Inositol-pentakisphosphate 2-kinase [Madurella mycetomatis]|uniref:Inositol-pentakisphosphate 2-kinase n=1 Tax=Madurella mycetomatis TaxID=100816 RepID=A0A175W7J3_9PEZI|nr:Inositol-pentakisphosphate 2-kinase [Madurella mycetomatis]
MTAVSLPRISELSLSGAKKYEFKFIGEGAANAVFEDGSSACPKQAPRHTGDVELQEYWETVVRPLFRPEDLAQQILIKLGDASVISRLNNALRKEEGNRRPDFRGSRIALAEYGMLVEDMRPSMLQPPHIDSASFTHIPPPPGHPDDFTLEFKPKWLAQSPNAPASATRCRTCARKAHQRHTKQGKADNRAILCPLRFLASAASRSSLSAILDHLSVPNPPLTTRAPTPEQRARLAHWLQTNTLLPRIREIQLANDRGGPLTANAHDPQFELAMTLRDCACFVRIPADPSAPVEAKLADMDRKNWAAKLGYWQAIERCLIEDGYYEERENPRQETDCQLGALKNGVIIGNGV